jgi:hypothetical protein
MTTAAQNAELAKATTRVVYFCEFQFKTATSRLSNTNVDLTWGGYTWSGIGSLGSIGTVEESDGLEAKPLNFTINSAQQSWLSLAIGPDEEYRGRPAKMYMVPLDEAGLMVGAPEQCWSGIMDMVSVSVEGETGTITLKCETAAYGLKRRNPLRLNPTQHKRDNPTDTGLDYLPDLISNPAVWLSQRFQRAAAE